MPKPSLNLPSDPFGEIFRLHVEMIKNDPDLRRIGLNVLVNEPGPISRLPAVRLSLKPQRSFHEYSLEGETLYLKCPFRIEVETFVDGTYLDQTRLGFAILGALFPGHPALEGTGLQTREADQLWYGNEPTANPASPTALYAKGGLSLSVHIELEASPL